MASRPRYQFSFPYYRPETPDDHYRNAVFLERAFNSLPLPKLTSDTANSNQINLIAGSEIPNLSVAVNAEIGEDFMVFVTAIYGQHANLNNHTVGTLGARTIMSLMVYYDGTEQNLQRVADLTVLGTTANFTKCATHCHFKSPVNGVLRFYTKVTYLTAGYAYLSASASTVSQMTVQSFGID